MNAARYELIVLALVLCVVALLAASAVYVFVSEVVRALP